MSDIAFSLNEDIVVPVNICQLTDDTDFKTIETAVAYNAAGMALKWNLVEPDGTITQTAVTPTTGGGDYDWSNDGNGMYSIGIPATGGASANNDTAGWGYFTGVCTGVLPWRGPTVQLGQDIDALMLEEAVRQGYREGRDQIVKWSSTATGRGTNLIAAQTAIEGLGTPPSDDDWVMLFLPPWVHDVGATGDVWGTEYVKYRALFPKMGGHNLPTDGASEDGNTSLDEYRPPPTQIICDDNNVTAIEISAANIHLDGFAIAQLSGDGSGTYHALYISNEDPVGIVSDRMYYWHKAPAHGSGKHRTPIGFAKHVKGLYRHNIANAYAWRVGYDAGNAGQYSPRMLDCEAGAFSFIGDYPSGSEGTHKATNSHHERCKAIGRAGALQAFLESSGYGSFGGCNSFGMDIDDTNVFIDVEMGDNSGGLGQECGGLWIRPVCGDNCLGGTTSNDHPGEFSGEVYDGILGSGSCGGNKSGITTFGKLTGRVVGTRIQASALAWQLEGATIDGSLFEVSAASQDCLTLLDSNSRITNSTVLAGSGGTPINAGSAYNVVASGNRYNEGSTDADGLGSNVTNIGTADDRADLVDGGAINSAIDTLDGKADTISTAVVTTIPATLAALPAAVWASTTRTLSSFGTLVTSIWAAATRTLTGTSSGSGPTVTTSTARPRYFVETGGTRTLYDRIPDWDGSDIQQAEVSSITYTIYALDPDDEDSREEVDGHEDVELTIADVLYDDPQEDEGATNYTFKHTIDISSSPAFTDTGTTYLVLLTITPVSGQVILRGIEVTAK